ncbi:type II toxin-antitoxin system VapC family toxin [Longispora albida]|uniref:type II toxin-antitoxin system VapC family toxin n=1 Tax=Longispora albida TaxID=203523 RepID=UPI000361D4CC|nr:PIN domain-containing protein [Longispora albida]
MSKTQRRKSQRANNAHKTVMTERTLVLDAGALIDVDRNPRGEAMQSCQLAHREGRRPILPSVVLGQVWRDHRRQHSLTRLQEVCEILPFTEDTARKAGVLLGESGTSDVVDAAVVVAAMEHNATVLTSDPGDLRKIAEAVGFRIKLAVL